VEDYKLIEIETNSKVSAYEYNLLSEVSKKFVKEDIFFEIKPNRIITYLHKLNFAEFKNDVEKLIEEANGSSHLIEYLPKIVHKIESIKSYGLKGKKRLYVGYNKERKVKNREQKEAKREIHFYANDNTFAKDNNEIPKNFENKILCGDSELILKNLPDNCIDVVFTSPPYNFGLEYNSTDDDHKWKNYFDKLFKIFDECIRVLKFGGRIIVNVQPLFSDYIPSHHLISNFFIQKKLIWKGEILWEKNNYNCKYTAWGSWKSPSNPYLKYTWEFLEIFTKGTLKKSGKKESIDINAEEFKKWVVGKWSIAPERKMKEFGHPAMFPEELVVRALKLFSYKNDIVLDPFNGAGTTTLVAKKLQRRFLGIDIADEYSKKAQDRIDSIML
jgi:DNA modification methylase